MIKNTSQQWGLVSQALHWGIALLMILTIALGLIGQELPLSGEKIKLFVYHKSVGILVLALVLTRIYWKLSQLQPTAAQGITARQQKMAGIGHGVLYGLMLALPISGWLLNSAAGFPFKWMDLFVFPNIPGIDEPLKDLLVLVHLYLFYGFIAILAGHIGMALLHHFKLKDAVLTRMLPQHNKTFWRLLLLAFVILAGFIFIKTFAGTASVNPPAIAVSDSGAAIVESEAKQTAPQWQVIDEQSTLGFTNNYDGIEFNGEFSDFTAQLFFDKEDIPSSLFDVSIDITTVTTFNPDWDSSLPDAEWFDSIEFPQARYYATTFTKDDDAYIAEGQLSLKGFTRTVPLRFTWQEREDGKVDFNGTATIKRTDFGIGSGIWQDDPTIGFDVEVKIDLLLQKY